MCPPCRLHGHSNRAASLLLQVSFKLILKMFEKDVMILFQDNAHLSSVCTFLMKLSSKFSFYCLAPL